MEMHIISSSTVTLNSDLMDTVQLSIAKDKGAKRQVNATMALLFIA
jgi:hypothetical protein